MITKLRKNTKAAIGALRIWHIPQVPMEGFRVIVKDVDEAKRLLPILWDYDNFQFEHNIKPDYSNASGLEVFVENDGDDKPGWVEWENDDGESINDLIRNA